MERIVEKIVKNVIEYLLKLIGVSISKKYINLIFIIVTLILFVILLTLFSCKSSNTVLLIDKEISAMSLTTRVYNEGQPVGKLSNFDLTENKNIVVNVKFSRDFNYKDYGYCLFRRNGLNDSIITIRKRSIFSDTIFIKNCTFTPR